MKASEQGAMTSAGTTARTHEEWTRRRVTTCLSPGLLGGMRMMAAGARAEEDAAYLAPLDVFFQPPSTGVVGKEQAQAVWPWLQQRILAGHRREARMKPLCSNVVLDACADGVTDAGPKSRGVRDWRRSDQPGEGRDQEYRWDRHPDRPEPSTWAMMLVGFPGLGFVGYRRRGALVHA